MSSHEFDHEAWSKMTMFQQMGNIGSEVGRTMKARQQQRPERAQAAFYRCLDLFDATASLWADQSQTARLRELLRAREEFIDAVDNGKSDKSLERYFTAYAVAARLQA